MLRPRGQPLLLPQAANPPRALHLQAAHAWFLNLDKLVRLLPEAEPGLAVFYSTPACYLASLHGAGLAWPAKQDSASERSIRRFVITEKAPTRAFS